jgi:uncharacterized protein (DUF924 family)
MTTGQSEPAPGDILTFWQAAGAEKWFAGGDAFDAEIRERFDGLVEKVASGDLDHWPDTPDGALALIIVLDQFSRNLFRGSDRSFSQDAKALALAKSSIARGDDAKVADELRVFFTMPLEHSEVLSDQRRSVVLCHALSARYLQYAKLHEDVISRFGRFPHRNDVLGRHTSPAERAFLDGGGFSAGTHKSEADGAKPDAANAG